MKPIGRYRAIETTYSITETRVIKVKRHFTQKGLPRPFLNYITMSN